MKTCGHCQQRLTYQQFYRDRGRTDGHDALCKSCRYVAIQAYRSSPKGKAMKQRYRHSPKGLAASTRHNQQESVKASKRRYWQQHGLVIARRHQATEKSRERVRRYQRSDKGRATMARLSALRRAATQIEASLSADQWNQILTACGHRCVYCGNSQVKLEQDHVIPIVRGGQHTMQNVVPSCRSCNARKNSRLLR